MVAFLRRFTSFILSKGDVPVRSVKENVLPSDTLSYHGTKDFPPSPHNKNEHID